MAHNWQAMDRLSGNAKAGAAIKANCYGLGLDTCLPVLRDAGAKQYFVAHWSEVSAASAHVEPGRISVLHGPISDADVGYAIDCGAIPVINSIEQARRWSDANGSTCHLMVDTGINRLGVSIDQLSDPAIQALKVETIMSHLASADENSPMNPRQLRLFEQARQMVSHRVASLANSAGIALGPDYCFDQTRPGLALYGGIPRPELTTEIKQVAFLEAAVIQTRRLKQGDGVGYNSAFIADAEMHVATVSLGYADGYLRSWAGAGFLEISGTPLPILGKVSMDMVVVDCTAAPQVREGDWLDVPYDLPRASEMSGLSQYELLTIMGRRLTC